MTAQGFPNIQQPVVNTGLRINQAWLNLLQSLWNRTGAANGNVQVPTGAMTDWAAAIPPDGWLVCDGSAVSRIGFASLFDVIGTTWGIGDGSNTFNLPDFRNRFAQGAGGLTVGNYGGADTISLVTGNLPAHNHGVTDPGHTHAVTDPGHVHTVTDPGHVHTAATVASSLTSGAVSGSATSGNTGSATTGVSINSATTGLTNQTATTGVTTQDTGSGIPVPFAPPYGVVLKIIKA